MKDVKKNHAPQKLSELTAEFVLFTPALLALRGGFDKDPVAYAAGQSQISDVYEITSPERLFDLPGRWGVTVWAVPRELWTTYSAPLGRLVLTNTPKRMYAKVLIQEMDIVDVLDRGLHAKRPLVKICSFAVDANFGYFCLSDAETGIPTLVSRPARNTTVQEAYSVFQLRTK